MTSPHEPAGAPSPNPAAPAVHSRRAFLFKLSIALNGAVGAVLAVPVLGYILGPALKRDEKFKSWVPLGTVSEFPEGETRLVDFVNPVRTNSDGMTAKVACWVRRIQGDQFQVFAINCAHLGCPVRWFAQSRLFLCPCHGGAYYEDGSRASGPPERGLFEYKYSIVDGKLLIHAGQMPTLSNEACNKPRPLVQLEPGQDAASHAASDGRAEG
ncbi:MAG: Rieske 2Fe-2S domain-containing protein [Terracidiphilus sp.]|nr:Rieske 2Fe-2S domain-containing protein [Terracidiphilus sp.]